MLCLEYVMDGTGPFQSGERWMVWIGKTFGYIAAFQNADIMKIAELVKLLGMLLQTKVYLFWSYDALGQLL
jgi:hypothetical protein